MAAVAFLIFYGLFLALVASGEKGGASFFSNPVLTVPVLLAGISGIAAFIFGIFAIIRDGERAFFVFISTLLGLLITFFVLGELLLSG